MNLITLALDTSTAAGSVAVTRGAHLLASRVGDAATPHARRLPGGVLALLAEAHVALAEVDLFAVVTGPGAFTGLRIGIATIQGLAFASARPAVGISALDALARATVDADRRDGLIGVWLDAARREVFTALYDAGVAGGAATLAVVEGPAVASADATLERWAGLVGARSVRVTGSGAIRYAQDLRGSAIRVAVTPAPAVLAETVALLAQDAHKAGQSGAPHALQPLYVRRPDAELAREAADAAH